MDTNLSSSSPSEAGPNVGFTYDTPAEASAALARVLKPFQTQLNQSQKVAKTLQTLLKLIEKNDYLQLEELYRSSAMQQVAQEPRLAEAEPILASLRSQTTVAVEKYRRDFVSDLQACAASAEVPLKVDFPRFSSHKGIEGTIDFAARRSQVNEHTLKSIDARRIVAEIQNVYRDLYGRPFDARAFIDGLYSTYSELLKRNVKPSGDPVPIQDFYLHHVISLQSRTFLGDMDKRRFRGYSLDQFAVDLWRYFQSGISSTSDGFLPKLRPGRGSTLWLIDSEGERRHIASISFQHAE